MITPFRQIVPGGQLSASELNRAFSEIARSARLIVDAPLELTQDQAGNRLRIRANGRIYARITGGGGSGSGSGAGGAALGPNCYSGVELWSNALGVVEDAPTGMVFDAATYPLVEMAESEDVPVDAIVIATMANDESHWEFLWDGSSTSDESGSGSGSGDGCVSISDFIACTEDGASIRPGTLCIVNGRLVFTPT